MRRAKGHELTSQEARKTRSRKRAGSYTMLKSKPKLKSNKKKNKFPEKKILVITSIILLVLIIFSASFFMTFFNRGFYNKEFKKYGQYDELGTVGVQKTVDYLIKYLTSENSDISQIPELNGFAEEEKSHLDDVRKNINAVKWTGIISFVLLIAALIRLYMLKGFSLSLKRIFVYGSISAFALLVILFVISLNFPSFFEGFHQLLFPQGNYTFPADYLLIKLFPQEFFQDFAKEMFIHTLIISMIFFFLGSSSAFTLRNTRSD
jgi:integral membrane protein (TIGR01906 family)